MSPEFNLIEQFFTKPNQQTDLSIGDDAALFTVSAGHQLVVSTDMLVAGTHFFADADAEKLGWKTLAVNLSDMAAMGAQAKWATLALALPNVDQTWLAAFAKGFFACANAFNVDLVGGDTTKGPLTLSVTIMGEAPVNQAISRAGASAGEDIWVSGTLGDAAIGLRHLLAQTDASLQNIAPASHLPTALAALHTPQPRCELGLALRNIASSCIDLSDGLIADLSHCLQAANLGATLSLNAVPVHADIKPLLADNTIQQCVLAGGEDYELCFTAPASHGAAIAAISQQLGLALTRVGQTQSDPTLTILYDDKPIALDTKGYDHFAQP